MAGNGANHVKPAERMVAFAECGRQYNNRSGPISYPEFKMSLPDASLELLLRQADARAEELRRSLTARCPGLLDGFPADRYLAAFDALPATASYTEVPDAVLSQCRDIEAVAGSEVLEDYHRLILLALMAGAGGRVRSLDLPESVAALLAPSFGRMLTQLDRNERGFFLHGNDLFAKDLALCRLKLLPCGAELIETSARVPRSLILRGGVRQALDVTRCFLRWGGFSHWYESHWDRRLLRAFNLRGYDQCYLRVADLLLRDPRARGLMSTSWWFDPVLDEVSPNLRFLRARPLEGGARLFEVGERAQATRDALHFSPQRQQLHAEGRYRPKAFLLAWARKDLLAWAARQRA